MSLTTPLGATVLGGYPLGEPIAGIPLAGLINTLSGSYTTSVDYVADIFA